MTYEEILSNRLLFLPVEATDSYLANIQSLLSRFSDMIDTLDDGPLYIPDLRVTGDYVKRAQKAFTKGLIETVKIYYDGKPGKAYEKLKRTLDSDLKQFSEILKVKTYESNESFFRIRRTSSNFPLSKQEMFHIPFNLRGRVATQRYSIPGFPCLYLGRTIYGCWEEMNRPSLSDFQVVRLENKHRIKYLDLTRPLYPMNLRDRDIYYYLMLWPLIACCSVKVNDYTNSFKPEYIIPQLLLQWIREKEDIDGIRYNSTHIDFHNSKSEGDFSNLVLPVKTNEEQGFCGRLLSMFDMTGSISWQLNQNAVGGGNFFELEGDARIVNTRIPSLEIFPGHPLPYSSSALGSLELKLSWMRATPID